MAQYAKETTVSPEKTRAEIEETLARYGADGFAYASTPDRVMIAFSLGGKQARIALPLPCLDEFSLTETGQKRNTAAQKTAHEKAVRQMWRVMLLLTKAKLEAIYSEPPISTFEREFLPDVVIPNGLTVDECILPQVEQAYLSGRMPPLALIGG